MCNTIESHDKQDSTPTNKHQSQKVVICKSDNQIQHKRVFTKLDLKLS